MAGCGCGCVGRGGGGGGGRAGAESQQQDESGSILVLSDPDYRSSCSESIRDRAQRATHVIYHLFNSADPLSAQQ